MSTDKPLNWLDHLKDGPQAHRKASDPPTYVDVPPFGLMELGADGTLRRDMGGPSFTVRYEPGDFEIKGLADEMNAPPLVYMGLPIHVADPMPAGVEHRARLPFHDAMRAINDGRLLTAFGEMADTFRGMAKAARGAADAAASFAAFAKPASQTPRSARRPRRRVVRLRARVRRAKRGWR